MSFGNNSETAALIDQVRTRHGLPALAVLVQAPETPQWISATGVRKQGQSQAVTQDDLWHIGSNAKAMTATLIGTFVQEGSVGFDTRLHEVFPELSDNLSPEAAAITMAHVLTHRAGFSPDPFESPEDYVASMGDVADLGRQRRLVLEKALSDPLLFPPGTDFSYSNTGFIVAAAVAERLGGEAWEVLLEKRVLAPLGITNFGFGAPGSRTIVDQPWGHRPSAGGLIPVAPHDEEHQNPPLYNSAGGLHISLRDWALFAREHLRGRRGEGVLLRKEIYERLQAPPTGESGFAMGWGVLMQNGRGAMLTHNGSDGNWFADIRVYPLTNTTFLMVTNDGREDRAKAAFKEIRAMLYDRYTPIPD